MHSTEVLAWTFDGSVFCPDCKPDPERRGRTADEVGAVFADSEQELIGVTCDDCRACYVDAAGWLPHADAVGPVVTWYRCESEECRAYHPSADPGQAPQCHACGTGRCVADADGANRARMVEEVEKGYAWPGGYPVHLLVADGGTLCPECVAKEWPLLLAACPEREWTPLAVEVHWEGAPLECAHCGCGLHSAYGDPDAIDREPPDPDYEGPFVPTGGAP